MTDLRTAAQQALEALESALSDDKPYIAQSKQAITTLKAALAEPEPANYKELLNKSEARLHEVAVHCERVERRLRAVNTAAMKLTSDLTCMDVDDDDRLSRDRVMERVMQWRNEWDKAMHNNPPVMGTYTTGVMAERQRIVNLLMIQHEAAQGAHNYWHVAAQLIQADVASDT